MRALKSLPPASYQCQHIIRITLGWASVRYFVFHVFLSSNNIGIGCDCISPLQCWHIQISITLWSDNFCTDYVSVSDPHYIHITYRYGEVVTWLRKFQWLWLPDHIQNAMDVQRKVGTLVGGSVFPRAGQAVACGPAGSLAASAASPAPCPGCPAGGKLVLFLNSEFGMSCGGIYQTIRCY